MCCLLAWFGFVHTGTRLQRSLVEIQSFDMKRVILEWAGVKDSDASVPRYKVPGHTVYDSRLEKSPKFWHDCRYFLTRASRTQSQHSPVFAFF